jgi:hypothetical protein
MEMTLGGKEPVHIGTTYLILPPGAWSEHVDILRGIFDELIWKRMRLT